MAKRGFRQLDPDLCGGPPLPGVEALRSSFFFLEGTCAAGDPHVLGWKEGKPD